MDPRFGRIYSSAAASSAAADDDGNGIRFGNGTMPDFSDYKNLNNGQTYENKYLTYDKGSNGNGNSSSSRYQSAIHGQSFRGLQFPALNNPPVAADVTANLEDDLHEGCDFSDHKSVYNGQTYGNGFLTYDQGSNSNTNTNSSSSRYQASVYSQNFRGLEFPPLNNPPVVDVRSNLEDELHEDCDLSDAILGFISQVLMEEDMEDKSCMLQESLDLQAAEKPFYEVLGKKYPPSPPPWPPSSSESGLTYVHHSGNGLYVENFSSGGVYNLGAKNVSYASSSNGGMDSPASTADTYDLCNENRMMWQFKRGFEEANKFLPSVNQLLNSSNVESQVGLTGSKVRKNHGEDITELEKQERNIKQAAVFPESTVRSAEIDLIFLSSVGEGKVALDSFRDTLREEKVKDLLTDLEDRNSNKVKGKGKSKTRGRKQNRKKEVIDLRTLLITCAQAVAADDRRKANELLKQINQHSSPFGDGTQRLAHCFANGLEARLAGTGSQIHKALVSKKTCAADYIKAYHLYIASSPFRKISNFASNWTIRDKAQNATRVHIIDFGILYGFQWPTFIQRISSRKGGPPRVRITGIDFPQPGFRPSQRIDETGRRLEAYAEQFKVPFEYHSIAKRWENVKVEDLMLDEGEFLVVNCMYRSKNLLDETVVVDSARNIILNLIKKINPNIFIHGVLNGTYNAPFFLTRFREALFHFSALFDMLETNVPRDRPERMLLEREVFGREALNVIACEGWERTERPETYKQWHARNLRAGLVPVTFSPFIFRRAAEKVSLYHKDFLLDEDNHWLLQGWKGRIIYAISCWKRG